MNRIDRLIIKARKSVGVELVLAMVERCGDSWAAMAHLWDWISGHSPTVETTTHTTLEAAVEHIHALARDYPNSQDIQIIVDDLPAG